MCCCFFDIEAVYFFNLSENKQIFFILTTNDSQVYIRTDAVGLFVCRLKIVRFISSFFVILMHLTNRGKIFAFNVLLKQNLYDAN